MLGLLGTAITASFFDSLNPSAIAQQMLLQAIVRKKRHIRFFIAGIALANMLLGLGIYYGVVAVISDLLNKAAQEYPVFTFGTEAAAGVVCLITGILLTLRVCKTNRQAATGELSAKAPSSLTPVSLFVMGAVFCAVELTSALPYFGFLAVLASYELSFPFVFGFIALYSFIYALPLMLIYFGYNRLCGTRAIKKLEAVLSKASSYIVPVVVALVGAYMSYAGITSLM